MDTKIYSLILITLIFLPLVSSASDIVVINTVAKKINQDCQDNIITLYKPDIFRYTKDLEIVNKINQNKINITELLLLLRQNEPYASVTPNCNADYQKIHIGKPFGCGIIECNNKKLDIIGNDYYWDNKKIIPYQINTYETKINLNGFINFYTNVNINITIKIIFTISIVLNITLSFVIYFNKYYKKKVQSL